MALSRPTRFFTLLFAAIQLAAPACLSVIDGAFARSARETKSHVEEVGQNPCTPAHSAACGICRFLSTNVGAPPAPSAVFGARQVIPPATHFVACGRAVDRDGFNSRAPPSFLG